MEKLLSVEDRFLITGRGLILTPDLSFHNKFRAFSEAVLIKQPDGTQKQMTATFNAMHKRMLDGMSKWSIVVLLPEAKKEDVPVGSEVYCSPEAAVVLLGKAA